MYDHFTDTDNTGAPLVPNVAGRGTTEPYGREEPTEELQEVVFSHRIQN